MLLFKFIATMAIHVFNRPKGFILSLDASVTHLLHGPFTAFYEDAGLLKFGCRFNPCPSGVILVWALAMQIVTPAFWMVMTEPSLHLAVACVLSLDDASLIVIW